MCFVMEALGRWREVASWAHWLTQPTWHTSVNRRHYLTNKVGGTWRMRIGSWLLAPTRTGTHMRTYTHSYTKSMTLPSSIKERFCIPLYYYHLKWNSRWSWNTPLGLLFGFRVFSVLMKGHWQSFPCVPHHCPFLRTQTLDYNDENDFELQGSPGLCSEGCCHCETEHPSWLRSVDIPSTFQ